MRNFDYGRQNPDFAAAQQPRSQPAPMGFRYKPDGNLEFVPGGPADPSVAAGQKSLRPIPANAAKGIIENRTALNKIDRAIEAVSGNMQAVRTGAPGAESAFGAWNYLGDTVRQRSDPGGVGPRAIVADIGSLKIHDRSGAAVTAAETPRLKPFIPSATDRPEVIITKLQNFKADLEAQVDEAESFYSEGSGYRPLEPVGQAEQGPKRINNAQEYAALPAGTQYMSPDGKLRTKQ
jgi:hypothetical protein